MNDQDISATLNNKPLLTQKELTARWSLSKSTLETLVKKGAIKKTKIGRLVRYRIEDVLAYERRDHA